MYFFINEFMYYLYNVYNVECIIFMYYDYYYYYNLQLCPPLIVMHVLKYAFTGDK